MINNKTLEIAIDIQRGKTIAGILVNESRFYKMPEEFLIRQKDTYSYQMRLLILIQRNLKRI